MSDKPSVDDLRARLRELGYLDAGVDRFVLRPVRGSRGRLSVAWRASLRIGALAALLLGPSAAFALAVRLPALVTGVRDAIVLALYLALLFGAATSVVTLAAVLLLSLAASRLGQPARLGERAHGLSLVAATIIGGVCLVYLVLWWRAVSAAGTSALASGWTWPMLAVAAGVSLLLGHAARLATLALVAGAAGSASPLARSRSRSRWRPLLWGAAAFVLGAALLALVTPPRADRPSPHPGRVSRVPTGLRLTLVAVDGLDRAYLSRLGPAAAPTLTRLLSGARATLPPSDAPDPARTWTSLATGQPPAVHGVSGIETRRVSGIEGTVAPAAGGLATMIAAATDLVRLTRPALTTSVQRRAKAFWEVAAEHGLSTLVVNWWATWPVPEGTGTVLSDRAALRLEVGGELDAEIAPRSLYAPLRAAWPDCRRRARQRVLEAFGGGEGSALSTTLRRAAEQDAVATELARRAADDRRDLRAVYLPGLDIVQHELVGRAASGLPASALAARVEALGRYYAFLDALVGELAGPEQPDHLVVLVADPGRSTSADSGLMALSGGPTRPGVELRAGRDDVMPTVLYALGVPVSRELPGRPRTDMFAVAFSARVPVLTVESFGPRPGAFRPATATPLDQEMLERLRSLGYVR